MTFDYLFSFFSREIRFWSDDLNEPCLSFRSFGKILWQEIVDGVKRERERVGPFINSQYCVCFTSSRSINLTSIQLRLHIVPSFHLSKYMEHNFHVIPQISLNLTKYIYRVGDPLRVEANLGTDGKWLHVQLTIYGKRLAQIWFYGKRIPTNKLADGSGRLIMENGKRLQRKGVCWKRMLATETGILDVIFSLSGVEVY